MTDKILVLSTCAGIDEARALAGKLVEERLAACVNIVPGLESVYHWQGSVERSSEVLLVIKTRRSLLAELARRIETLHTYTVPEVIATPIVAGSEGYLFWLDRELKPEEEAEAEVPQTVNPGDRKPGDNA
jgi:periplasmic divalent cation tolerance protein